MSPPETPLHLLDPSSAEQADSIRTAMADHWEQPGMEALCERVMQESPDGVLREEAKVALARFAYIRYDYVAAERLCREALCALWDSRSRGELAACINLALICLLGRRHFEALVLARRGVHLARESELPLAASKASLHLAGVLRRVGDHPRARLALAEAEALLPSLELDMQANQRANIAAERVHLALADNDIPGAESAFLDVRENTPDDEWHTRDNLLHAHVLVATGQHQRALEALARAREDTGEFDPLRATRDRLEVECLAETKGVDAALWSARSLLDWLEAADSDAVGSGLRLHEAERVGVLLLDVCRSPGDARRAYEAAAGAALERIRELAAFSQALPGLSRASSEDRRILEEYRTRFEHERAILLQTLADLLEAEGPATQLFGEGRADLDAAIKVCAWCEKVQGPDGIWFTAGQARLPLGRLHVTHGICEACFIRETGDHPAA